MARPLFACWSLLAFCAAEAAAETLVPSLASIQLNGDAQLVGQELVLTDGPSQLSSVWYETPLSLAAPFRVTFSYRAESPTFVSPGGGFGLVLQAAPTGLATLGQAGDPGHGYGGIANSLGLIVDLEDETLRLVENGGSVALQNRTDWNSRDANGVWEHGAPGYPLPAGVDPDATPPLCQFGPGPDDSFCTVGGVVVTQANDLGAFARFYDHYYVGHGFSSGSDVPGVADGDWLQFEATFLPSVLEGDGSIAVLYRFGSAANGAGYLGVLDYFYVPNTPIPADGSFFAGLPEYTPATSSPYFVGFTASSGGTFSYAEQSIRDWRIETGIENTYLDYVHPVPEPGTASVLGIGLLALMRRLRARGAGACQLSS